MSYKEVRDLFEYLKILGYPKQLKLTALYTSQGSLENFKLVFDILRWLIDQYEPGTVLLGSTDTELDRTLLVRSVVEFLAIKAGIKLNPIRLYSSSMIAATELLKVVNLIMTAQSSIQENWYEKQYRKLDEIDIDDRIKARQRGRELSSQLIQIGAALHDLLGNETENQRKRNLQAGRQMESSNAEKILNEVITSASSKLRADKVQLEKALLERQAMVAKVERKKTDLERLKQRLDMLQKIRPAYSEEFEKAEEEIQKLFGDYFIHVRCLDSLRAQMNANTKIAQPISEPMIKSGAPSGMRLPDGIVDFSDDLSNGDDDDDDDDDDMMDNADLNLKATLNSSREVPDGKIEKNETDPGKSKLRIKTGVGKTDDSRLVGRILSEEGDSDLDSSLQYNHDDDSDTDSELNPENLLDESVANVEALYNFSENVPARAKSAKPKNYQSDEDF